MHELGIEASIPFFGWTPQAVVFIADDIYRTISTDWEREVFSRLMYAREMKPVWREILAEDRNTGGFLHPIVGGGASALGPKTEQHKACGKVFNLAFCAARDKISVSKTSDRAKEEKRVLDEVDQDFRVARELAANGLRDPSADAGAAAVLRLAMVKKERARRIVAGMRDSDDPLSITNDRGDRMIRGVATEIGAELRQLFGKSMIGITRTLTMVALNRPISMQEARTAVEGSCKLRL